MKEVRQCSSCGGFCKKSGCERENVKPEPSKAELMAGIALQLREIERLRERIKVLEDALRKAIVQNEHDMLMTGEELCAARAALGDKT